MNWPATLAEARVEQERLRSLVRTVDAFSHVRTVAGVDVGFPGKGEMARAAVAVLRFPELDLLESSVAEVPVVFPYVPGFLSFREIPVILKALERISAHIDLLLCDGHGIAHPRRVGIACHLGIILDMPSIGVGKSRLVGAHDEPGPDRGDSSALVHRGEVVGSVLRTRRNVAPLFVSPGHRVSLESAVAWVLRCTLRYRLPETTRWAHRLASHP